MPECGSPGFKGYDYQITATIWVALELFLGQQRSEEVLVEPLSKEDIEASIKGDTKDTAVSTVETHHGTQQLYIQIKRRSTGPWDIGAFTDVFVGTQSRNAVAGSRQRPYKLLQKNSQARYVFLTDAGLSESLTPYKVSGLLQRHSCLTIPHSIKKRTDISDLIAAQFAIIPMQLEELLDFRIDDLLLRKGQVPTLRMALCREALKGQVCDRLLGKRSAAWTFADISSTLREFGGQPFINPRLAEYVNPLSYAEIEARLRNQNAVLLVGPPGTGKTMTSEIIAARSSTEAVNVIREKSPDKIRELISRSGRFLFLLSDPWGANRVDDRAPVNWTDELPKLLEFANPDKRFVVTSRADVLRTAMGDVLAVKDAQQERKHALSSIAVHLVPEDYSSELRRRILRNKAARLSAWQQDFVSRQESAIVRTLRLPFSIEQFVFHLGQLLNPADAELEDLLNSADLDTIVNTVRQQVQAWGASHVECASVAWALLSTWNPLKLELVDLVTTALTANGVVLELQSFFKHLLACGNVNREGNEIEAHPKVIEALEQVIAGKASTTTDSIRKLMISIADLAQSNESIAKLLLGVARAVQSKTSPVDIEVPAQAKSSIFQVIESKLASEERSVFLEGLRDASEFKLQSQLGKLVSQLLGESKGKDDWLRHWSCPPDAEVTEDFTSGIVANSKALNIFKRFIEFSLPATRVVYPVHEFVRYLKAFPVDLSPSFLCAFHTVVDLEQVCFNDDLIVTACLTDEASFQQVRASILQLWDSNDAWFEGFDQQLSAARECELDAGYSAHLEDEPSEHYGLVQGLAKAYVAVRRERTGWQWLTQSDNQRFISAWSEAVAQTKIASTAEEWDAMVKVCRGSHMREYWSAVKETQQRDRLTDVPMETFNSRYSAKAFLDAVISIDADPLVMLEQISPSINISARTTLVVAAAGLSRLELEAGNKNISKRAIVDVLTKAAQNTNEAILLEALFELVRKTPFSTIREKYGTALTGEFLRSTHSRRDRNEYTCSCIAILRAVLNQVDDSLLESLLDSSETEVTQNAAMAAAVGNRDSLLHHCLSHKHYRVRRTAFQALSRTTSSQTIDRLITMARDKSAPVRLEVAKTIGNLQWTAGARTLLKLLTDTRDFSEDSLTGGWPCFEVARAAAESIQELPLDDETERALMDYLERGRKATADPVVRAKVILALSNSQRPAAWNFFFKMLSSSLSIGKEPAPRYVLRCAAAEAIAISLTKTPTPLTAEQTDILLRSCLVHDPTLSVRATIAAALSFESTKEKFGHMSGLSKRHAELFIAAALAKGDHVTVEYANALLGDKHPLLPLIQTRSESGAAPGVLSPQVLSWIDQLDIEKEMARAIRYSVNEWLGIVSDEPDSLWIADLEPKRIRTLTMRSMFGGE